MASKAHQLIAGLVVRKMRQKGYQIISFDGNEAIISDISLRVPPIIKKHRPDILGIRILDKKICIGEAKTSNDLYSKRTKEQIKDYSNLILADQKEPCELIIGIPKSCENKLEMLLKNLGIHGNSNISYVWMPDELLPNEKDSI